MNNNFLLGISLTASFLSGVLALFAPCCITFLLPSYLGTIFKQNKKIVFYTLVFALGLSSVLIPVALGFRFFIFFFDAFHKNIYYLGGLFLIAMGIMTIKPFFHLPQFFHTQPKLDKHINIVSVFGLGLMSGLTSSCCAPVLFAAVTLTTLSPTLLQAVVVSGAYVLGIVFPLFVFSLFYEKLSGKFLGKRRQKMYELSKWAGSVVFIGSGVTIVVLTALNKIQMYQMEKYNKGLRLFVFEIAKNFQNPFVDLIVFSMIIIVFYGLMKRK